jgi:hypothetical protein
MIRPSLSVMKMAACAVLLAFPGVTAAAGAADDLPRRGPADTLDFEPKLMLDGPNAGQVVASTPAPGPEARLEHCKEALRQAEQRAVDSEQLYKEGVLAKVEVEARYMSITRARKELADAELAVAALRADAAAQAFAAHSAAQAQVDAANAELKAAQESDAAYSAALAKARLEAATLDLRRKRKLYSEGVGSLQEVEQAEDRVVTLSGTAAGR